MRHVADDFFIRKGETPAPPLINGGNRGSSPSRRLAFPKNLRHFLLSKESSAPPPSSPVSPSPSTSLPPSAMPPKIGRGKVVKSAEALRLEALRRERATFPPQLDAVELRDRFYL